VDVVEVQFIVLLQKINDSQDFETVISIPHCRFPSLPPPTMRIACAGEALARGVLSRFDDALFYP
jgi:hypothetical protein